MPHLIARHPETGNYLRRDHPEFADHAEEISGELRKVTMFRRNAAGELVPMAIDYVPVEHVEEYRQRALSNEGRTEKGDVAWDAVIVGDEHDSGEAGDDQHWHDVHPADVIETVGAES